MIILQICPTGTLWFRKDSGWHRTNGPAIISANGYRAWYINDQRHRVGGPARIHENGTLEFWVNDNQLSEYELMFLTKLHD